MINCLVAAVVTLFFTTPTLASKQVTDEAARPYGSTAYFLSDPIPEDVTPTGNPLDWAGAKIGLDVRNFELPRAYENEYRFNCRFPIIDAVSNRPLYMKQWTEDHAEALMRVQTAKGISATGLALEILTGDAHFDAIPLTIEVEAGRTDAEGNPYHSAYYNFNIYLDYFRQALDSAGFTPRYARIVSDLYFAHFRASVGVEEALGGLTDADVTYFAHNPVAFLLPDGETIAPLTGNTDTHKEFIDHLRRANLARMMAAGDWWAEAVGAYLAATQDFDLHDYYADTSRNRGHFEFDDFVINGFGDDLHQTDFPIIIDLGGNDTYTNNAGGAQDGVAACIDHSGNDTYDAKDRRYVQGCGLFGVGMLADLEGDDHYTARHFAQGAGIAGVGVLYDAEGNDTYSGHGFTQGAAMFGLGMLMDNEGDDSYDCATLSQGGATTLGLGILSDLSGNDKYKLGTDTGKNAFNGLPGYGQGGALSFRHNPWRGHFTPYGGVGFLIDGNGNDDYLTTGWCDQGGSYIMSLGALYDGGGNDHYKANTGQGSGIHITNAILIDKDGDDHYEGAFRTGGSGGDRTPGILIDYAGNDTYQSGSSSYGSGVKPFSYSLMIDYSGDDNYITANPVGPILFNCWDSFGGVWPESAPNLWPYAICLDLGGNDNYQVRNRRNNSIRHSFGHGIMVDMEWKGGDVIGKVIKPMAYYGIIPNMSGGGISSKPYSSPPEKALHSVNLFVRFSAVGSVVQDTSIMDALLSNSPHMYPGGPFPREYNRDVLECIHTFLIEKRFPVSTEPALGSLLFDADPEVRTIIADDIGVFGLKSCEDALVKALDDPEPQVRRFSYRSLMAFKSEKGIEKARVAVRKDNSEDVRRLALAYLITMSDKSDIYQILADRLENDEASSVKVAAADGLGRQGNANAVKALRQATQSYDIYVQRAAAKALCELGEVEGIGILIESLSFPSIDAFYNYDYNVPNFIATYAGYDLPEPDRFEQSKWREWFVSNRDKINLKENIAASKAYISLTDSLGGVSDEKLIEMLETFLKIHPNNRNASGTLAAQLNRIAWDMATAPKDNPRYNPEQAILYSRRSVELVSDLNYWDTLAEGYFAAGRFDESAKICNEQLVKSPGNKMFIDRLNKIIQTEK